MVSSLGCSRIVPEGQNALWLTCAEYRRPTRLRDIHNTLKRNLLVQCRFRIVWDHLGCFPPWVVPVLFRPRWHEISDEPLEINRSELERSRFAAEAARGAEQTVLLISRLSQSRRILCVVGCL